MVEVKRSCGTPVVLQNGEVKIIVYPSTCEERRQPKIIPIRFKPYRRKRREKRLKLPALVGHEKLNVLF